MKIALATLAAVALCVGAVAATADEDGSSQPPGSDRPVVTAVEPAAAAAIAKLAESRGSGDDLPTAVAAHADGRPLFGINPDLSRRAIANTGQSLYLVPGDGHVCAVLTDGAEATLSCDSTEDIADGRSGPGTVVLSTGDVAVYGIVADGVDSVTVATATSDSEEIDVQDNGYFTVVGSGTPLRHVSYVGASGAVEFPIVDPSAL